MAQLSDDCFAFGGELTPIDVALAEITARTGALTGSETVPLASALGRVLTGHMVARAPVPPFANSAVDGYAVRHRDLNPNGGTDLPTAGRAAAGHPLEFPIAPGTAVRIFTGAPMPDGADTVFMQEDVKAGPEGIVRLPSGLKPGANARRAGEDVEPGELLIPTGKRLTPADLGLLAGQGISDLAVRQPLRVAVLSTGDELIDPAGKMTPGRIFDSNRVMLAAMIRQMGAAVTDFGILPDDPAAIISCLEKAARDHHAIVTSGGMSTGEEDHLTNCLRGIGSVHFWRLAIKPGRPVGLGQVGGAAVVGLPGNPAAAAVCFAVLARPLLARLSGELLPALVRFPVKAAFSYRKKRNRREFVRVRLENHAAELPLAHRFPKEGAGILSSIAHSDGFVELAEDLTHVNDGDRVSFLSFDSLGLT